jgi:antitoxin component of RelBE/YafQ-DinJ toxin-antitoxin module
MAKEPTVAMNLSIPKSLKEQFAKFAYSMWTNPTNLIRMFMQSSLNSRTIYFKQPILDIELESVDISDWWDDFIKETNKITKELEKAFA